MVICFDNYPTDSIKAGERKRCSGKIAAILKTNIQNIDRQLSLLSEMPKFWACPESKIVFQQFFIQWITDMHLSDKPIYLGGCHGNGENDFCYRLAKNDKERIHLLQCTREEAEDLILFILPIQLRLIIFRWHWSVLVIPVYILP